MEENVGPKDKQTRVVVEPNAAPARPCHHPVSSPRVVSYGFRDYFVCFKSMFVFVFLQTSD